jgi:hypothetical protein
MNRKTILALLAGLALCAAAACNGNDNANTNANTNANRATATPTATPANTNTTNTGATNWNANHEEFNKNANEYRSKAKNAGETIGDDIEDGWIHFKVRGALAMVDDLRDSTINVDVDKNVVTLRGTVANAAQKTKAATVAKVDGVKSVTNKLEVKADSSANANTKSANANANAKK